MERNQGLPPVGDQPGHQVHILRVVEATLHGPLRLPPLTCLGLRSGLSGHGYSHRPHLSSTDGSGASKTWQPFRGGHRDRIGDCLSEWSAGTVPRSPVQAAPVHDGGRLYVHELREHLPAGQHSDGITGGCSYKVCQDFMNRKLNILYIYQLIVFIN